MTMEEVLRNQRETAERRERERLDKRERARLKAQAYDNMMYHSSSPEQRRYYETIYMSL